MTTQVEYINWILWHILDIGLDLKITRNKNTQKRTYPLKGSLPFIFLQFILS